MTTPSVKQVTLPGTLHEAPANATDLGRTPPTQVVTISVIVRRKNHLDLKSLGGRHISRQEFNEKYAGDPADFAAMRKFAHNHGLSVDENASSLPRRTMVMRGPAQAMDAAFGIELHNYERDGHKFHGFKGAVSMPDTHAEAVETVLGLDCRPVAKPHHRMRDKKKKPKPDPSYTPVQVAGFYDFPKGVDGSGQTIGIIELGGGYNASDLQTYFSGLDLTPPHIVSVSVDGGVNAPTNPNSADGEVALDIEVAGAVAPGANIAVYFTTNTAQGFLDAITTAAHDMGNAPTIISISWGGPESGWTSSQLTAIDNACQSAAAMGITITVAAGDDGSSDGVTGGGNNVDFPGSSPHVLCCGGTKITTSDSKITSEVVWNDGSQGGATGGGVSSYFPLPTWQQNAGVPTSSGGKGGRGVPDVAGDASPTSGYDILVDGTQQVVGGTSAVAPLWAGLIALINQQTGKMAGLINPDLYAAPSAFNDITQGNNGAFSAGPGWDPCTGLGSPIGTAVATAVATAESGTGTTTGTGGSDPGGTNPGTGGSGEKHHPHHPKTY
ncbi:MAG TPA: S53 family peptidase [Silvibacterium sp.]|nr:S53 family peptidase [Silvibacterium sp.]